MNLDEIRRRFAEAAPTYDKLNHILTFGLDVVWRRCASRVAAHDRPKRCLDACTGTADMAIVLRKRLSRGALIMAADVSTPMIELARRKKGSAGVRFVVADARALPFPNASLDLVTVSFAARNLNAGAESLVSCLIEFHRVLRPGGRFVNLETSRPRSAMLRWLTRRYVRACVESLGGAVSGSRSAYAYLASSIPRFLDANELAARIQNAGFARVVVRRLTWGVAAIHEAFKPQVVHSSTDCDHANAVDRAQSRMRDE
ncbi:MAG: ubiquinone/menaquinone biosynthesis methyltransferase [Vicinamibacteria bacterium]|nr:ubiquinone/menaquinone biosynthesis methyltransferase [Vicinamibacteria bacterium]